MTNADGMTSRATGASFLPVSFQNFELSAEVVRGVQAMGFAEPTPIQLRAFPIILAGKDLIGTAQTGTGKTAAFALPILTLLGHHGKFRCLVLEPTRELATTDALPICARPSCTAALATANSARN
jgi:superfamily II DNA/RNA helicase